MPRMYHVICCVNIHTQLTDTDSQVGPINRNNFLKDWLRQFSLMFVLHNVLIDI